jgi:uracil phosphoribosyltransferase
LYRHNRKKGAKNIIYMGIVGVDEGINKVREQHPDVDIFLAAKDEKLNEKGYIVPGLGDCGDRLFCTK